ncbi:TPA: fimbrial protein [Morganella morganii]
MKIKLLAALAILGMSGNALAVECTALNPAGFVAETLIATTDIIQLRADLKASSDTPIGVAVSPSLSTEVRHSCPGNAVYGVRPLLSSYVPYPGYDKMYKTNIEGIGVKFMSSAPDGTGLGPLPRDRFLIKKSDNPNTTFVLVDSYRGRLNAFFYKLSNNVKLNTRSPDNNLLLNQGIVGYNKIEDTNVAIYAISNIYITGIPVCTVDRPEPVDFGSVNSADIRSGVEKPFSFGINCKTDYGNYDITASIRADKRTSDNKYIRVTDSNNKDDSLIIEITDTNNIPINVDNSTKINLTNFPSGQKASFRWKAKLKKADGSPYPAQGKFNASAIITLDIK